MRIINFVIINNQKDYNLAFRSGFKNEFNNH